MSPPKIPFRPYRDAAATSLLTELIDAVRDDRARLCSEWLARITRARLMKPIAAEDLTMEAMAVHNQYVIALRTGNAEGLRTTARNLLERTMPRRARAGEVIGIVLFLRDVLARATVARHATDVERLDRMLDAFEAAANTVTNAVALGFLQERERVMRVQQDRIRDLSTPVLHVRERLLVLPMIGTIDPQRIRHVTERLLHEIRAARAKIVILDLAGVPEIESSNAEHLVQTVDAARLLGAKVIISGLPVALERRLIDIGVDMRKKLQTAGNLQHGIELAERLLGYRVSDGAGGDSPIPRESR